MSPNLTVLVVRTPNGWMLTPSSRNVPIPADLATMRGLLSASAGRPTEVDQVLLEELRSAWDDDAASYPTSGDLPVDDEPFDRYDTFVAVPGFLGLLHDGHIFIEGHDRGQAHLDEADLVLLDAIGEVGQAGDVFQQVRAVFPEVDDLDVRARRLVLLGRLRLFVSESPSEPASGISTAETGSAHEAPPVDDAAGPAPAVEVVTTESAVATNGHRRTARSVVGAAVRRVRRARPNGEPAGERQVAAPVPADEVEADPRRDGDHAPADVSAAPEPAANPEVIEIADEPQTAGWEALYRGDPRVGDPAPGAIPVYAVWQREIGPLLSLGMLTANARHHNGGALSANYEIRRPEDPGSFFADLERRSGPAILLLSNYIWSIDHNLDVARRAVELNPDLVVVHGGPHTPKYDQDCRDFFAEHAGIVHVTVRSEGEETLAHLLEVLAESPSLDLTGLSAVPGISFLNPESGEVIRTEDRERLADLNELPSPYLTGEFDHLEPDAWTTYATFETNRGCPYGCTFCDWGSNTLSRIRKFDLDRVAGEMAWAGERAISAWVFADANTGIMSRDIDVIDRLVAVKHESGVPTVLGFNVAKNTTKHLTEIVDRLVSADVAPYCTLALQTRDEDTLEAVQRSNISTEHYVSLAASFRRRKLPLQADIMLGLPGQTPDSLAGDLQFLMDHEVPARIWITQLLPNSPMNDPEYRERWKVNTNGRKVIMSTASFTLEDREELMRIRHAYTVFERYGILRHLGHYLQWDLGIPVMEIQRRIIRTSTEQPGRYPLLDFTMRYFDFFPLPLIGWHTFYGEVRRFLRDEFSVPDSPVLDTVFTMQEAIMPEHGRTFPATIALDHDYVSYYRDATRNLWFSGAATGALRPLEQYGPGTLEIHGDPDGRCDWSMAPTSDPRDETMNDFYWLSGHMELDTVLVRNFPEIATGHFQGVSEQIPEGTDVYEAENPIAPKSNPRIKISSRPAAEAGAPA